MVCIYCGNKTQVTNSRSSKKANETWRRRECQTCGSVFTTYEQADLENALRVKKKSSLEPFSRDKLMVSVYSAITHRKTALTDASELADTVIKSFTKFHNKGILESRVIAEITLKTLERFDSAGAAYYKAHYF